MVSTARRRSTVLVALTAVAAITGATPASAEQGGVAVVRSASGSADAARQWAAAALTRMTLPEKVGQLFTVAVHGFRADEADPGNQQDFGVDTPAEVIEKYHLGGVIYFAKTNDTVNNIDTPRQVAELSNGLQRAALGSAPRIPLLVSTDQEEGLVTRIPAPATEFPGSMALGAGRSAEDARTAAAITGSELRAMGINVDNAPDADVNVNPANPVIGVRSFSADPELAADLAAAQVEGYQSGFGRARGVAATAKHFPGHGDTDTDSHTGLPVINHDRLTWEKIDAPPFRAVIERGVDVIMSGHIVMPKLDGSGEPATLSPTILSGLLRGELGYQGVIITDSLHMAGVRQRHSDAEIPVLALQAGADQLLMPQNLSVAIDGVLAAVRSGRLSEQRIDESALRVLELKYQRGIVDRPLVDAAAVPAQVGNPARLAVAQEITDRTTTALTNDAGLLPLRCAPRTVLITGAGENTQEFTARALAAEVRRRGAVPTVQETGTQPSTAAIDSAVAAAATNELTVVLTRSAVDSRAQQELLRRLAASGRPVVAVAVGAPYDAATVPAIPTWLVTYSANAVAMRSLAKILYGEVRPEGKLPVGIPAPATASTPTPEGRTPDRFPFGYGLTW